MSAACSGIDDEDLENQSISDLVSILRTAYRTTDFDKVEEALVAKEVKVKKEVENKNKGLELLQKKCKIDPEEFEKWRETSEKLKNKEGEIQELKELVYNVNKDMKRAQEKEKKALERYEKLLEEVKKNKDDQKILEELNSKNSELELDVELWKKKCEELENQVSRLKDDYTALVSEAIIILNKGDYESGACSTGSRGFFTNKGAVSDTIGNHEGGGKSSSRHIVEISDSESDDDLASLENLSAAHLGKRKRHLCFVDSEDDEENTILQGQSKAKKSLENVETVQNDSLANLGSKSSMGGLEENPPNPTTPSPIDASQNASGSRKRRNGRGPTRGVALDKYVQEHGRIKIHISERDRKPVCRNASKLNNKIGFLTRTSVPLKYKNWASVPTEIKSQICHKLLQHFDLDLTQQVVSSYLERKMSFNYRDFRFTLSKYYKSFESPAKARANRHPQVENEKDWALLCDRWETDLWKNISATNAKNREKVPYTHRIGSRSFVRLRQEMREKGHDIDQIELFRQSHFSESKGWINDEAREKYEMMCELKQRENELDNAEEHLTDEQICEKVLGRRSGHVKGVGWIPKSQCSSSFISQPTDTSEVLKLQALVASQQQMLDTQQEHINLFHRKFDEFVSQTERSSLNDRASCHVKNTMNSPEKI